MSELEIFEVELQFEERVVLSNLLLHSEGNVALLGLVRKLREQLSLTEEEAQDLRVFQTPDGRTGWNAEADKPRKFGVGPSLKALIAGLLQRADMTGGMTLSQLSLYEKFVGEVPDVETLADD